MFGWGKTNHVIHRCGYRGDGLIEILFFYNFWFQSFNCAIFNIDASYLTVNGYFQEILPFERCLYVISSSYAFMEVKILLNQLFISLLDFFLDICCYSSRKEQDYTC